jgi:tetrahydromethanopterin S-methyltransferase subunit B
MMAARKPKQSPGQRLRAEIVSEMAESHVIPDSKEDALLDAVQTMVDRMAELDAIVTRDGPILTSVAGTQRVHPGLIEYRQMAGTLPRMLAGIVIGDSSTGVPKDAVKQRAANARWNRRDQLRSAQAARAGL